MTSTVSSPVASVSSTTTFGPLEDSSSSSHGIKTYKVSKLSGKGTTHKIREHLNFTDEKKWKQFSSRRLELIDKFNLSERKASEQDSNIRQIANILRTEFAYPDSSAGEFEKLVTAAVQSVRRNRKRSKKRYGSNSNSNPNDSTSVSPISSTNSSPKVTHIDMTAPTYQQQQSRLMSPEQSAVTSPTLPALIQPTLQTYNKMSLPMAPKIIKPFGSLDSSGDSSPNANLPSLHPISSSNKTTPHSTHEKITLPSIKNKETRTSVTPPQSSALSNTASMPRTTDSIIISIIKQLLEIKIPLEPIYENALRDIPTFLKENLLNNIQRSRTCSSIVEDSTSTNLSAYANLETLGEMSICASISFVIERYFNDAASSKSIEHLKLNSSKQVYLSSLANKLLVAILPNQYNSFNVSNAQVRLFFLVIGAIVKDYGFDSTLYPLNEIIHHMMKEDFCEKKPQDAITTPPQIQINNCNNNNHVVLPSISNTVPNGLNILSAVSQQVENEELPRTSNIPKTSTPPSAALPNILIKKSFADGNLPQPIQQI